MGFIFAYCCTAQSKHEAGAKQPEPLKIFLRNYFGEPDALSEHDRPTRYSSVIVELKDDGTKQAIVYITGRAWCGSGGCVMLILDPQGASYRVVTQTTITRPPIRVLNSKSNEWHDLGVMVAGGGIKPGYEAQLSFDGKAYPSNPTVSPARPLKAKVEGKTVIPVAAKDQPLYQ
ncbi:MAG TPA: hypothetical protein VFI75_08690 [Candidatus Acidoferrum sp.]|nr:hypothetical protein [Candidatus Acidoferrum sp.]